MKKENNKDLLKRIKQHLRLNTPAPKVIKTKKDYTRKQKHERNFYEEDKEA